MPPATELIAPQPPMERSWIEPHQEPLWRYLRFLGCSRDDADDVFQDTLTRALSAKVELSQWEPPQVRAWMRRTAHHRWIDLLRRRGREPRTGSEHDLEAFWIEREEEGRGIEALRACLAQLDERSRQALALRYGPALGRVGIGEQLGVGHEAVKKLLQRARNRLRACIETRLAHD